MSIMPCSKVQGEYIISSRGKCQVASREDRKEMQMVIMSKVHNLGTKIAAEQLAAVVRVGDDYENGQTLHEVRAIIRRFDAMIRAIDRFECPNAGNIPCQGPQN